MLLWESLRQTGRPGDSSPGWVFQASAESFPGLRTGHCGSMPEVGRAWGGAETGMQGRGVGVGWESVDLSFFPVASEGVQPGARPRVNSLRP